MLRPETNLPKSPTTPKLPLHQFAKWPPDDSDLPAGPANFGGGGGGLPGDDGNFKKGAVKPAIIGVATLILIGAGIFGFFAIKGESEKMDTKQIAQTRSDIQLMPKDKQLPEWRKWALREDAPALRQDAFANLGWARDAEGLDAIIKGLSSADHRIRGTAAMSLVEYGSPLADKAKPALLKAFKEADNSDEPQIAWALAVLKENSVYDRIFGIYSKGHLAPLLRVDGSKAFDPEVLVSLSTLDKLATLRSDPNASVRQLVATALAATGDAKWTQPLIELVKDKDVDVAREAAVGLGKIANEQAMGPLLEALTKADKESRSKFLEALRDGVGAKGLILAVKSVSKESAEREKFQTKVIFDMLRELHDPRAGELLVAYIESNPKPHWKTEAALRLAEVGDIRAVPTLAWRLSQDPMKLYNQIEDPELRQDDNERVVAARMLADLAVLYPDKRAEMLKVAEEPLMRWVTDKPQPHANGLRALVVLESKEIVPKLMAWADPKKPLPDPGAQPPVPLDWETSQSALRYLGWTKDPRGWSILERQFTRQGAKKYDITMEGLQQGGLAVLGMTLRALGYGAADGFAQWGDSKAFPMMVKYIEDKEGNEQSRLEACFALSWVANDEQMKEVAKKVHEFSGTDPKKSLIRACYLETLIHRPVPAATNELLDLIRPDMDLDVRHQAARAIGIGGVSSPDAIAKLQEKLKDKAIRSDAALALLIGADTDTAKRAIAVYNDGGSEATEELKIIYNGSFGYWSDKNYENGDVARWVANAEACGHVKVNDALQDWPKSLLVRSLQGDFDNGPRSMTRVQLRVRLYRDAKGADEKKRTQAISILKFMKERGVLMALRSEPGAWQDAARQAFFEVMNPKVVVEALPDAPKK
ncbi:MAG: HEAT repeat domain-containing protein [Polyangiaceae bacterium]